MARGAKESKNHTMEIRAQGGRHAEILLSLSGTNVEVSLRVLETLGCSSPKVKRTGRQMICSPLISACSRYAAP